MCTETVCKVILYILNIAFFLVGGAVLIVGIIALVKQELIFSLVELLTGALADVFNQLKVLTSLDLANLITANAIIITVVGGVVFAIGFFGCCGACKKNACLLTIYAVIVALVCGAQIGLGVYAYVASDKLESNIKDGLTIALSKSYKEGMRFDSNMKPAMSLNGEELAWDYLQIELQCCGVTNLTDYSTSALQWNRTYENVPGAPSDPLTNVVAPPSCCILTDRSAFPDNIPNLNFTDVSKCMQQIGNTGDAFTYQKGCYDQLRTLFDSNETIILAVFVLIVVIEIIAIAAACILKAKAEK